MSYPVQPSPVAVAPAAPSPAGRPATVSAATVLLWVMAVAGLIYAITTLAIVPGTVDKFRDLSGGPSGSPFTDTADPEYYVAVVWLGAAVALVLAVIVFALYVVLGLALRRGSNAARIATLVVSVLGVLAGAASLLTLGAQRSGDTAPGSLGAQLSQSYPSGWVGTNAALAVAQILGYLVVAVLVVVTPRAFFRRPVAPAAPPAPGQPAYGMPYPGYGVTPGQPGYGAVPGQPGYGAAPGQPGFGAVPGQPGFGYAPAWPGGAAPSGPSPYARPAAAQDPAYGGHAAPVPDRPEESSAPAWPASGALSADRSTQRDGAGVSHDTSAGSDATARPAGSGSRDPDEPVAFPFGSIGTPSALPSVATAPSSPDRVTDAPSSAGGPAGQAPAAAPDDEYWSRPSE